MSEMDDIKKILLDENILNVFPKSKTGYRVNIWVYRKKSMLADLLEKYPFIKDKIEEVGSFNDMIACIMLGLDSVPKCECCSNPQKLYDKYPFYKGTCGEDECLNALADRRSRKTRLSKYGSETWNNPDKNRKTNLMNHGGVLAQRLPETQNKVKETCIRKYGGVAPVCNKEIQQRIRNTTKANHGVECMFSLESVKEKKINGCIEKYGTRYYLQSDHFKEFCQRSYGGDNPMCSIEISRKTNPKYKFNDILFDSSAELAYYMWNTEKGNIVEREPCYLEYINSYDNSSHKYLVDFRVNGQLVEIKGENLVDPEGNWVPLRKDIIKCSTPEEIERITQQARCKGECARNHNVKVIFSDSMEIRKIKKELYDKYGNEVLDKYRINTRKSEPLF